MLPVIAGVGLGVGRGSQGILPTGRLIVAWEAGGRTFVAAAVVVTAADDDDDEDDEVCFSERECICDCDCDCICDCGCGCALVSASLTTAT